MTSAASGSPPSTSATSSGNATGRATATSLGTPIEINNIPMIVAGVLPPGFKILLGPNLPISPRVDVWFPARARL